MKQSLITFAERTFGADDPKAKFLRELSPAVERVVTYRNAAEHEGGWSGTLRIVNFQFAA